MKLEPVRSALIIAALGGFVLAAVSAAFVVIVFEWEHSDESRRRVPWWCAPRKRSFDT